MTLIALLLSTTRLGEFESDSGDEAWEWYDAQYPTGGWTITFQASGSVSSPDQTFVSFTFETTKQTPALEFNGDVYEIELNGSTVGWVEVAQGSGTTKMMWWSNGTNLTTGRRFDVTSGDDLEFIPGSLPTAKHYPVEDTQID